MEGLLACACSRMFCFPKCVQTLKTEVAMEDNDLYLTLDLYSVDINSFPECPL